MTRELVLSSRQKGPIYTSAAYRDNIVWGVYSQKAQPVLLSSTILEKKTRTSICDDIATDDSCKIVIFFTLTALDFF